MSDNVVPLRKPLDGRERAALDFIRRHVGSVGYPPSVRQVGAAIELGSTSMVVDVLERLAGKGYIRRDGRVPRGIVLLDPEGGAG